MASRAAEGARGLWRRKASMVLLAPWLAALVGMPLLVLAYAVATSPDAAQWRYPLFWAGLGITVLSTGSRLLARTPSIRERMALVVLLGAVTYVPKLLRGVGAPVFFDEVLHWHRASCIAEGAGLFHTDPVVPASAAYPGFEALLVAFHAATGLSIWTSGVVLAGVAHLGLLLGVFTFARQLSGNVRLAGLSALIYACSPGFTFFTTLVAYETVGLPLAVWTLIVALHAARGSHSRQMTVLAAILVIATGLVHHVSSAFVLFFLGVFAVAAAVAEARRRNTARAELLTVGGLFLFALAFNLIRLWGRWEVVHYLVPQPSSLLLNSKTTPTHQAFAGSGLPMVEQVAGFLAPIVVTLLCAIGFFRRSGLTRESRWRFALLAFFAVYPVTFVGVLYGPALAWVHRPWPFLYVGISVLAAGGLLELIERPLRSGVTTAEATSRVGRGVVLSGAAGLLAVAVLLVGNTATEVNDHYRFPGPWIAGADTRSSTPEMRAAASWLRDTAGDGARVVADKDTSINFLAYGRVEPVRGFPTWELTSNTRRVPSWILTQVLERRVEYVVVDQRMAQVVNIRGYWYGTLEPKAYQRSDPLPVEAVTKLEREPWASRVYESEHLRIYRVDADKVRAAVSLDATP